ncbi:MAG: AI-2E family transporter [Rhodobacterales bacterium]|jgi:predicted PurR-regulated permease PerM|nr:AI-2E family transporter [Rhodobacterales bacterium]
MALPVSQQAKYWGLAAALLFFALWFLGDVMLPFVMGGAMAYLFDPIVDRMERAGLTRPMAVTVISLAVTLTFVLLILLVIPLLVEQTRDLINAAPEIFKQLQTWLTTRFPELMDSDSIVRRQLLKIGEAIQARGGELVNGVVTSAMSVISVVLLIVIVPVVTVYLLLDWDKMIAKLDDLLPRDHAPAVRQLAREIDATLASFIRGQGAVCLVQATFYGVGLMLAGLNFGLLVGVFAGVLTFIPYVGALVGGGLAIGIALFQFWGDWVSVGIVAGIFAAGQVIEGNILTPKLVGGSVGLHPVWLIFALSVFGSLFGFVGMLVAVPVSAMIGVFARFLLSRYKDGMLYRGTGGGTGPT